MNNYYFKHMKRENELKIQTGFRMWQKKTKSYTLAAADAAPATFVLNDWSEQGVVDPDEV